MGGVETSTTLQIPFGPVSPSRRSSTVIGGTSSPKIRLLMTTVASAPSPPPAQAGHRPVPIRGGWLRASTRCRPASSAAAWPHHRRPAVRSRAPRARSAATAPGTSRGSGRSSSGPALPDPRPAGSPTRSATNATTATTAPAPVRARRPRAFGNPGRRGLELDRHVGREVVQQVPQSGVHHSSSHRCSGSSARRRSMPRETNDFTVPTATPRAWAVSASLRSS